jgi:hypothetical protein
MQYIDSKIDGDIITIALKGHIDSANAPDVEKELSDARSQGSAEHMIIDAEDLTDIVQRVKFHINVYIAGIFHNSCFNVGEYTVAKENQNECQQHAFVETRSDGDAHAGAGPETRSGG